MKFKTYSMMYNLLSKFGQLVGILIAIYGVVNLFKNAFLLFGKVYEYGIFNSEYADERLDLVLSLSPVIMMFVVIAALGALLFRRSINGLLPLPMRFYDGFENWRKENPNKNIEDYHDHLIETNSTL